MKVKLIKITNICGIESLEVSPGAVTVIEGENGSGKTSVIEAVKSIFAGGHDATLLRNGAEKGEIVLVLDDGTEVKKTVKAGDSTLDVKHPTFGRISQGATFIKKLSDSLSINPIEFLQCDAKKRAAYLLEALPLKITPDDLKEIALSPVSQALCDAQHPFVTLAAVQKGVYDERTGVNRLLKDKRVSADELAKTVPAEAGENWGAKRQEVQTLLNSVQEEYDALTKSKQEQNRIELGKIQSAYIEVKEKAAQVYTDALQAQDQQEREEIARINAKYRDLREAQAKLRDEAVNTALNAKTEAEKKQAAVMSEAEILLAGHRDRITGLKQEISVLEQKVQENARVAGTLQLIEKYSAEANELEKKSADLSARLERLEELKARLAGQLPIAGIEVRDGEIFRDGVPFDRLNTAQQIEIAVKVAAVRSKDLGLICMDGIEALDAKSLAEFENIIKGNDLQAIVTRVIESGDINIKNK